MHEHIGTPLSSEQTIPGPRTGFRLAWVTWGVCILLILSALILWFLGGGGRLQHFNILLTSIVFACFGTVGALIASQRPKNTIGWIFCIVGIGTGITDFSGAYSSYGTIDGHVLLPGSVLFNWLGETVWPLNWGLFLIFLPLLFPTGRLLTRRWRVVAWLAASMMLLSICAGQISSIGGALAGSTNFAAFWDNVGSNINILELPLAIVALVSLMLRFKRAKARERQQIKWLAYGVTIMVGLIVSGVLIFQDSNGPFQYLFDLAILCLPLSIGISILRTQLYDIDRLISRTLIYLLLTALLVLTYLALVFGLQFALQGITRDSPVPIVVSTLVVAALFQPLRRVIQNVIDRSFYRRRYNAEQVLTNFGATLRNEIDLTQLSEQFLEVVQETIQPEYASLWLCAPARREQSGI